MPTYEYICEKCDHRFDFSQSIKDEPIKLCPAEKCTRKKWGKGKVRRVIGAGAGLIFKGSGFYITDYRSDSYKQAAKKDSGESKPAGETKTESKAETKSTPAKNETKAAKAPKT